MLNPIWLKTFSTVAACHSFTEAGRRLDLTQSSVSEHIRRLEQSVGRRLFVRDTHSLAMTPDGEAMLAHASVILQALSRAESQFRAPRLKGRVRLGSSDDIALGPLPTVLAAFRNAHPDVELEITIGMTGRLYQMVVLIKNVREAIRGKPSLDCLKSAVRESYWDERSPGSPSRKLVGTCIACPHPS